jgi:putative transposase
MSLIYAAVRRILGLAVLFARGDRSKEIETLVLRHQVAVLRRQVNCARIFTPRIAPGWPRCLELLPRGRWSTFFVQPSALLRWHCDLVARRWTYPRRRPGRPATARLVRELVLRMASENPTWRSTAISTSLASGDRLQPARPRICRTIRKAKVRTTTASSCRAGIVPGHGYDAEFAP